MYVTGKWRLHKKGVADGFSTADQARPVVLVLPLAAGCGDDGGPSGPGDTTDPSEAFAHLVAGPGVDVAYDVTVASNGDRVIVGAFTGSAQFKLPPRVGSGPMADSLTSNGATDILVVGYHPDGSRAWERNFGGTSLDVAVGVTADGSGNLYMSAAFSGMIQMGTTPLTSAGDVDVLVAKIGADHEPVWAFGAGGSDYDQPWRLALDPSGNVIVTGGFGGSADFGGTILTSEGFDDVFLLKLSNAGGVVWVKSFGGANYDDGIGVDTDADGNIYVAGSYTDSTDFGGTQLGTPNGVEDAYLAKYDAAVTLQWVRAGHSDQQAQGWGVAVVGDRVCVAGNFEDTATFGTTEITSAGEFDVFVACYSLDGTLLWLRRFGGAGSDETIDICPAGGNEVFIAGGFEQVASFGSTDLTTNGGYDAFLVRLGSTGVPVTVDGYGGTFADSGTGIATADGRVILAGYLQGAVDFDGIDVTGEGSQDPYIFQR